MNTKQLSLLEESMDGTALLLDAKERFEWVIRYIDRALEQNREVNKNLDIRRIA